MIGLFNKTETLYDALGNETRLGILILLRAKKEMDLKDLGNYLNESKEVLENHLNILGKINLIQKLDSMYMLTEEGIRRLSELRVTESEAIELTKERERSIKSAQDRIDLAILSDRTDSEVGLEIRKKIFGLLNDEDPHIRLKALEYFTIVGAKDSEPQ